MSFEAFVMIFLDVPSDIQVTKYHGGLVFSDSLVAGKNRAKRQGRSRSLRTGLITTASRDGCRWQIGKRDTRDITTMFTETVTDQTRQEGIGACMVRRVWKNTGLKPCMLHLMFIASMKRPLWQHCKVRI